MKKFSIFVAFLLLGIIGMQAAPVDASKARKVADHYVRVSGLYDKTQKVNRVVDITSQTPYTGFYVFRIEGTRSGKGFILVSADDCARPVLGYSFESDFVAEGMPEHVAAWLQGYENEIQKARKAGAATNPQWNKLLNEGNKRLDNTVVVDALLTTRWSQSPRYNNLCPYDSTDNSRTVTGCVATAMGQILRYWSYPTHGIGHHSYTHTTYGLQSANFAATSYDWANMPAQLTASSSATQINAVATLLYHCGVAVNMNYGTSAAGGSGATTVGSTPGAATAENAFKNYFDYASTLHGVSRSAYSDVAWKQLLMGELDASRPMMYRGSGSDGGHAFVCDGYDSDTNFHFNWGWSGNYNGFFAVTALTPGGYSFTNGQQAIIGIQPANSAGLAPRDLQAAHIGNNGATLTWVDRNMATGTTFQVVYGPATTFDTNSSATYTSTTTRGESLALTGLTANTAYKAAIRITAGNAYSNWSDILDFSTIGAPQAAPALVGFESGLPSGWSQEYVSGNIAWTTAYGGHGSNPAAALTGSSNALLWTGASGSSTKLVSPMLTLTGSDNMDRTANTIHKVAFGHAQMDWSGDIDMLSVYYRTSPSAEWMPLTSYTEEIANWQRDTLTLPNPSGTYQVAFEGELHWGYGVCLDDISFFTETEVNDSIVVSDVILACDSYTVTDNNGTRTFTQTGTYRLVYTAVSGIDSIIMRTVVIGYPTHNSTTVTEIGRYIWHDVIYTESGTYTYNYTNNYGCACADTLHLTIVPCTTEYRNQYVEACDEYTWSNGVTYYESTNDAYDTLTVDGGCPLIMRLNLTIYHSTHNNYSATAMNTYTWHDSLYFETGAFPYHYNDVHNCPSADTLHLTITPAPAVVVDSLHPYHENFEGDFTWYLQSGTAVNRWAYGTATANGGTHALYISNDRGHTNHYDITKRSIAYASKLFTLGRGTHYIGYDWKCYGENNYDYLRVFLVPASAHFNGDTLPSGPVNANTNTYIHTVPDGWITLDDSSKLNLQSNWQSFTAEANVTTPGDYRLVFLWICDNSVGTAPPAAIDDISIELINCGRPSNLAVSDIHTTTATVSWIGTGTQYQVAYGTGTDPDQMTLLTTTDSTATLTGLSGGTTYHVYVRNICSPTLSSAWSGMATFTTPFPPVVVDETHPFSDGFENPCTWWLVNGDRTNRWYWGTAASNGGSHSIYISNNSGNSNTYNNGSSGVTYATKLFALKSGTYHVGYDWRAYGERTNNGSNYDYLRVFLAPGSTIVNAGTAMPNGTTSAPAFANVTPAGWIAADSSQCKNMADTWQHFESDVAIPDSGDYMMMFVWITDGNAGDNPPAAVDNVSVTRPNCTMPTDLHLTSLNATDATLAWIGNGDSYQIAYGTANNINQMSQVSATTATHTLTGLTPTTHYFIYVRSICHDGSQTAWSGPIETTTPCLPFTITPVNSLTEDFENGLPGCWNTVYPCNNNAIIVTTNITNYTSYNNSHSLRFNSSNTCSEGYYQYFISQEISCAAPLQLSFYHREYSQNNNLWVGYSTTGCLVDNFTNWIPVPNSGGEWTAYNCDLPQGVKYVAIRYYANHSYYAYVDDIALRWARHTITATAADNTQGTVSGSGAYNHNEIATLRATPAPCHQFSAWNDGNSDNPRHVTVTSDSTFTAFFAPINYTSHVTVAACDSYTWHDSLITTSGNYSWHGNTLAGCDSTATLALTINHSTHNTMYDTTSNAYTWHGTVYSTSGVYTYNYINAEGCASTDTLHLVVDNPYAPVLVDETHPFHDGFEEAVVRWQMVNGDRVNKWTVGNATNNGGTHALYVSNDDGQTNTYTGSSPTAVFASKTFILPAGHYYFSYDWKCQGESTFDFLRVALAPESAVLTAGNTAYSGFTTTQVPTGWISLDGNQKKNQMNAWQTYVAEVDITTPGNYQMAFYWRNDNNTAYQPPAGVDNVNIIKSTCARPTGVAANNVTSTTATLTWSGTASTYQVAYGTTPVLADMTVLTVNGTTLAMTALSPSAGYYVYVKALCSATEQSAWSDVYTFRTQCGALTSLPYSQDFENCTTGATASFNDFCWKKYVSQGNYPYVNNSSTYAHGGEKGLYWYTTNYYRQYVVLPEVESTLFPLNTLRLTFWARSSSTSYQPRFVVGVMTEPADSNSFVPMKTIDVNGTTWTKHTVYLNNYTGAGRYIALRSRATSNWTAYLDDFTIDEIPACPTPSDLALTAVSSTSATLTWWGLGNGSYTVAYGTGTNVNYMDTLSSTSETATLATLNPNTEYHVYVRANCPGTQSTWSEMYTFRTECTAITSLPYTEGFEYSSTGSTSTVNFTVNCWRRYTNGTAYYLPYVANSNHSGTHGLYWPRYAYTTYGTSQYVVLPEMAVPGRAVNAMQLSFWARNNSTGYSSVFQVGVMTDPTDTNTFTLVNTVTVDTNGWAEYNAPLSSYTGTGAYIAVRARNSSNGTVVHLDDFTVDVAPTCDMPTNLAASNVTPNSATITWNGNAPNYQVGYGTGNDIASMTFINSTSPTAQLTGLTANTDYHVYVRGICSFGNSPWSQMLTFHTPCPVIPPVVTTETECESYTWHGQTYTSSNTYTFDTVIGGCTYTDTLHLTINHSTHNITVDTACENYTWHGQTYTTSTSDVYNYTNAQGCASADTLHLTINHGTHNSVTEMVDESYTWHGSVYTATGVYTYSYTNADGCASTDTLHLTVDPFMPILVNETHPFHEGFERTILHWQVANGTQTNQWYHGTAAHSTGDKAIYISNNNGTSNAYTTSNATSAVFATKKFILPAGHFYFSYDWRCNAEADYDYMRVYLTPATTTFTAGTLPTGVSITGTPNGWRVLDRGSQMNQTTSWGNYTAEVNITDSAIYQVVFLWYNDSYLGDQPPAAIDEVRFVKSDCLRPTDVALQSVGTTTATLSWTGTAASYQVAYGTTPTLADMDTLTVTGNTATLTGLAHTTTHYAYVRSLCNDEQSAWSTVLSFRTACGPVALPYSYGFEDASMSGANGTINECWHKGTNVPTTNNYPYPYSYETHAGYYALYMNAEASYYSYIVLPQFDNPLNRTQLTFWGRATSSNYPAVVEIGVVTNPTDITTFQQYATFDIPRTGVLQWHCDTVMFDSYQGNGQYIALRLQGGGNSRCYLDDFTVEAMPECSGVRNLAVAGTTDNSVTLTWHETGAATSWGVEYGPRGFLQGSGTLITVNDTTATITGLTNNTWYDFYVHSDCLHATSRGQRISGQTDCGLAAIPFLEDFNGYTGSNSNSPISRCWYKCYSQGNNQTSYPMFTYSSNDNSEYFLNFYSTSYYYSYLVLPYMQGNIHDQMLRFKVKTSGGVSANIQVGVMTTATNFNTFQQVQQFTRSTDNEWTIVNVPFNSLSGTNYRIAIVSPRLTASGSQSQSFYVDDIEVVPIPDCNAPASLTAGSITTTSATLNWSAAQGISRYRVVYTPHGDYDSTYRVTVDSVAATSLPLTGLQMGTTYDVEVYSLCITGSLSTAATTTFSTSCSAHSVPFTENFDHGAGTHVSPCWNNGFYGAATSTYPTVSPANPKYEGDKGLLFFSSSNNMYSYAILPELDDTLSLLQFKLQARTGNGNNPNASLQIGTVASSANITTFQTVQNIQLNNSWQYFTVPLTSVADNSRRLAIRYQPNGGQGQAVNVLVDDIIVERIPACNGPARVTADRIVYNGARLHWPAAAGIASYSLEYGPSGFTPGQGTQVTGLTDTLYTLTGLTPATAYSVYLWGACNSWSQSSMVTTAFSTGCLEELPYAYGFEGLVNNPNGTTTTVPCWVLNENAQVQRNQYTSGYAGEGTARMRFSINQLTAYAVMPKLNESIENLYMTLQVNTADTYFDEPRSPLQVGVMTDPYDLSTFTTVASLMPTRADQWQSFRVDFNNLTGDNYYIAFRASSTSSLVYNVYFDDIQVIRIAPYNIDLTLADATRGTVAINGVTTNHAQALAGSDVTLTATANHGYTFSHWAAGITANPYTFTMPDHDVTYNHIVFSLNTYTVTALSNDTALGTVTGGGSFDYLDTATLTATANGIHSFLRWSDGVTTNPRTLVVADDTTLTALFQNNCPTAVDTTVFACDSYIWHGTNYTASGLYTYDRSTSQCPVVDTLRLTVSPSYHLVDTQTACESYRWINGQTYTTSTNTPTVSHTTAAGCDSVITLNLTVNYHSTMEIHLSVCDSIVWHGNTYTFSGTYYYDTLNAEGCDSLTNLVLTVDHSTHDNYYQNSCGSYTWNGTTYTTSGTYTYSYTNAELCASTDTLHLVIDQHTDTAYHVTACDGYRWNDSLYTASGVYTYNYSQAGSTCTNVDTLYLTINYSAFDTLDVTACDSYFWHDSTYLYPYPDHYTYPYTSTYTFATTTLAGCDSVETLHLTLKRSTTGADIVTACDSYTWIDGITYTASNNTATHTLTASNSCDSVVTLFLTLNYSTHNSETVAVCDSYTWHGTEYTASGIYTYDYTNAVGCASTDTLNLTINHNTPVSETITACDSYTWHGTEYTVSGIYTFDTMLGTCIRTDTLNLTIHYGSTATDVVTACDRYTWINGITYTASSTSTYTVSNSHGCDSVVTLNLTINYSTTGDTAATACDSFTWRGTSYTNSTNATSTTTNAAGCDSTITLHLTVHHSTTGDTVATACDSFTWNGTSYTSSTSVTRVTPNAAGCDSTVTLHLTVNYSTMGIDTQTACDHFTWMDGMTYTSSTNTPTYTLTNAEGCDSVVTLDLTINNSLFTEMYDTACEQYIWLGNPISSLIYGESGDYSFTTTATTGCDSTVTLHLTIHHGTHDNYYQHACDTFTWHGTAYTTTGTYPYEYTNGLGCASVDTLHLTVDQHSDTAYHVTLCDSVYRWNDSVFTESGIYIYDYSLTGSTCTNVDTLYLTLNRPAYTDIWDTACDGYNWVGTVIPEGDWYHESGTYTRNLQTIHGCDSVATLHLTIHHSSTLDTTLVACDTLLWIVGDTTFSITESGDYIVGFGYFTQDLDPPYPLVLTQPLTNAEGCDSMQLLHVTINHSYRLLDTAAYIVTACDSYLWHGTIYTADGIYNFDTVAANGCDSTLAIDLTLRHSSAGSETFVGCDSFSWHDSVYTASGIYTFDTLNADGCDSTVTLDLTLNHGIFTSTYQAACDSFAWHDSVYTSSGTFLYEYFSPEGCGSVDTLVLTLSNGTSSGYVVETCDSYVWNGTMYTESGNFVYDYSQLGGDCQNVDTLFLTLHYSVTVDLFDTACDSYTWGDSTFIETGTYYSYLTTSYGCDSTTTLFLTIHYNTSTAYTDTLDADGTYTWHGQTYTEGGTYLYDYFTEEGCASTDTLHLISNYVPVYYTLHARSADTTMGYVVVYPDSVALSGDMVIVVGVPHEGFRFLHWSDGDTNGARIITLTSDTTLMAYFEVYVGINGVETPEFRLWAETGVIHVEGNAIAGMPVKAYDLQGRILYNQRAEGDVVTINTSRWATGVYLVRVGNLPAQRVVLR